MTHKQVLFFAITIGFAACGGGGGGGGASCAASSECATGEYCQFDAGSCGEGGVSGACTAVDLTTACPESGDAVCSCDGLTFFNECFAQAASQSIRNVGECP